MLELHDLHHRFGEVVALDGLTFSVPDGQMFGFVGPNGAGKTTAMRAVIGIVEPDAGSVTWRGQPIDEAARRRIGYMPEERGLYPKMRVIDQLVYLARLLGLPAARAKRNAAHLLEQLGLADRSRDAVEELSLGNQQRVQLAAALVPRQEELQNAMTPLTVTVLLSFFAAFAALNDPGGTVARVASLFPTSAPLAMPVRVAAGSATAWEIGAAILITVAAGLGLVPLAARVYRGAVLRTGTRVKLREALRAAR